MLDIAETLDPLPNARARRIEQAEFPPLNFDVEGGFMAWTATDSAYGARSHLSLPSPPPLIPFSHFLFPHRHLAETWASTYLPPHPKRRLISASTPTTPLSTIEHLVHLGLLGFLDTAWLFDVLVSAEIRLRDTAILDAAALGGSSHAAGNISLALEMTFSHFCIVACVCYMS
jgi:glutaminyl-peptide cyclotransferase